MACVMGIAKSGGAWSTSSWPSFGSVRSSHFSSEHEVPLPQRVRPRLLRRRLRRLQARTTGDAFGFGQGGRRSRGPKRRTEGAEDEGHVAERLVASEGLNAERIGVCRAAAAQPPSSATLPRYCMLSAYMPHAMAKLDTLPRATTIPANGSRLRPRFAAEPVRRFFALPQCRPSGSLRAHVRRRGSRRRSLSWRA